jgi:hypothetical protein
MELVKMTERLIKSQLVSSNIKVSDLNIKDQDLTNQINRIGKDDTGFGGLLDGNKIFRPFKHRNMIYDIKEKIIEKYQYNFLAILVNRKFNIFAFSLLNILQAQYLQ